MNKDYITGESALYNTSRFCPRLPGHIFMVTFHRVHRILRAQHAACFTRNAHQTNVIALSRNDQSVVCRIPMRGA